MNSGTDGTWCSEQPDPEFARRYPNSRQCSARSKQKEKRCQQPAILGGTVCRYHGAGAPAVRRAAQLRLLELVDPAVGVLAREMIRAEKSADRQRAANSILDRAGVPRSPSAPDAEVARQALIERLLEMRAARMEGAEREHKVIESELTEQGGIDGGEGAAASRGKRQPSMGVEDGPWGDLFFHDRPTST